MRRRRSPRGGRWNGWVERRFLKALAATGNVRAAAAAVGYTTPALYHRRKRYPRFAAAWDRALNDGRLRLANFIHETGTTLLEPVRARFDRPGRPVDVISAMHALRLHRAKVRGGPPQRYNHRQKAPDMEQVRASIHAKIDAVIWWEANPRRRRDPLTGWKPPPHGWWARRSP